ncbi:BTE_HP_G0202000.mRNA.1.CDS.1 [Saccharomyces cerevisiae]|nr:BTE_HP_G0007640.mRNA.1.CDS.1 [Saccharomyces cerevisiae]CAI5011574.1 BTE_HP_G0067050.mRNA.1.CDS.1 [Saccharomyces cerevisiae]CAI5148084.1 BTE_HP_G0123840.mRNA.1.CDS.1 [Saccharomyces cerevisiae]CAI5206723.1 BTE_HP_G0154500.mRNA.1.CDS.1 [Saccharomyces cerevisiae]CAI5220793.1 BTE_HP_G0202000.mRNA.1.CDS.1 [Saccharomyces cerevisiae]
MANRGEPDPKKSTESICSLTKPQLYSLYDDDVVRSEDNEIYEELKRSVSIDSTKYSRDQTIDSTFYLADKVGGSLPRNTVSSNNLERILSASSIHENFPSRTRQTRQNILHYLQAVLILSLSGFAYHELSRNLHDNHLLHPDFASRPLLLGVKLCNWLSNGVLPNWLGYGVEGLLFGSVVPILDNIFQTEVLKSSVHYDSLTSVIRSINAMLGVTFGIRKIQWNSSLQAAGAWGLLNIILWLFFDGSISMLMSCICIGVGCCISCYKDIIDGSQFLYFMDFYFLGSLMFGKLGRYLYSH